MAVRKFFSAEVPCNFFVASVTDMYLVFGVCPRMIGQIGGIFPLSLLHPQELGNLGASPLNDN